MILLLMVLFSLSTVYFTRLLEKKGMKTAAVMVAVLFAYIIVWTYAVFILDVADLGFSDVETRISILHGSDIYHSFVDVTAKFSLIPLGVLEAIVIAAVVVIVAGFAVTFHGLFEITKTVFEYAKRCNQLDHSKPNDVKLRGLGETIRSFEIIKLHCRMNC